MEEQYPGSDKLVMPATKVAALLADALLFASGDRNRPILAGVRLEAGAGRVQAIATDSYVLGAITCDGDGTMVPIIVDVDDIKRILTLAKSSSKSAYGVLELVFEREGASLQVRAPSGDSVVCRLIDGNYPNYEQLFGTRDEGAVDDHGGRMVSLNTSVVFARLAKLRLGTTTKVALPITLETHGTLKPVHLAASADGFVFRGLAMPVRVADGFVMSAGPEAIAHTSSEEEVTA